jgi:hypothetical protein
MTDCRKCVEYCGWECPTYRSRMPRCPACRCALLLLERTSNGDLRWHCYGCGTEVLIRGLTPVPEGGPFPMDWAEFAGRAGLEGFESVGAAGWEDGRRRRQELGPSQNHRLTDYEGEEDNYAAEDW